MRLKALAHRKGWVRQNAQAAGHQRFSAHFCYAANDSTRDLMFSAAALGATAATRGFLRQEKIPFEIFSGLSQCLS
jgi:hypothetical protein